MTMDYVAEIKRQLIEFDIDGIKVTVQKALDDKVSPVELVDALGDGMKEVGDKYESGEFFFSELIMAGETMKEAMEVLKPALSSEDVKSKGKVVVGTVKGDLHDIGKDLVVSLLVAAGVEVIDVGVDVPAEKFVDAVKNEGATVVGLSALLSTTITYTKEIVAAIEAAGIRDKVKIIVGGAAATDELAKEMGADSCAADAVLGVRMIEGWLTS
jgi:5-methyltetrahydrofolate--homocysteine methyltransferase